MCSIVQHMMTTETSSAALRGIHFALIQMYSSRAILLKLKPQILGSMFEAVISYERDICGASQDLESLLYKGKALAGMYLL